MQTLKKIFAILILSSLLVGCVPTQAMHIVILWHAFSGAEAAALQKQTDQFNAQNPWNIVLVTEQQSDISTKITATTPEHYPDLVIVWPEDLYYYHQKSLATSTGGQPLQGNADRDDLLPMAEALYTVNGQLIAQPLGLATYLLYYNADWLNDLGYDAANATWEDLRRTACAATSPSGGQVGIGFPAKASTLLALLTAGGSAIIGEDDQYRLSDANGVRTANVLNEIIGGNCGIVFPDRDTGRDRLSHSSMAMIIASSKMEEEIENAVLEGRNFSLGLSRIPSDTGPGATLWYGPGLISIAPSEARQAAAAHVMDWFFSAEAQALWHTETNYLPVRRSLITELAENADSPLQANLFTLTLTAADSAEWTAWPRYTNHMACRASLLRGLLSFGGDTLPSTYVDIATTACNTGIPKNQAEDTP